MFKEVHTLEDLKYVHFVVLIFRDVEQCEKYCIYLDKMKLSTNKQYWGLIIDVTEADEIHTKDGFYVSFKSDNNCMHQLWIPCELCEKGLTAYTFRTPDEEMTLLDYKAAKIADILERTVLKHGMLNFWASMTKMNMIPTPDSLNGSRILTSRQQTI